MVEVSKNCFIIKMILVQINLEKSVFSLHHELILTVVKLVFIKIYMFV